MLTQPRYAHTLIAVRVIRSMDQPNKTTRVVLCIDTALRNEVKNLAKEKGRILSDFYVEIFKKGHALILKETN